VSKGRKPLPPSVRTKSVSISISPSDSELFKALGEGSLSVGLRRAAGILRAHQASSLAAIRQAAERRDQANLCKEVDREY
jgi:hypothetical protein